MISGYSHGFQRAQAGHAARLLFTIGAVAGLALAGAPGASADDDTLSDIIVTAQKFEQHLQDVPITIQELSSADLTKANVVTAYDLPTMVSGLTWANEGAWVVPSLRGVTTTVVAVGAPSPVAIYLDGVYQPDTAATVFDLPDVNRIEVLKGPQGTLFGRNATGGAISIYTLDPSFTPTGKFSVTAGAIGGGSAAESGHYNFTGFFSGPLIGDTLAGSISANYNYIDGYFTNDVTGEHAGKVADETIRAKLLWKPADYVNVLATAYYAHEQNGAAIAGFPYGGITVASQYPPAVIPTQPWHYAYNGVEPVFITNTRGASVKATFDLDAGTLTNILAYTSFNNNDYTTGHAAYSANPNCEAFFACVAAFIRSPEASWTEELDWASKQIGHFRYVTGLYVFTNDAHEQDQYNGALYLDDSLMRLRSYAAFGEGTYDITDDLSAILGVRVTRESLKADGSLYGALFQTYADNDWLSTTPRASLTYKIAPGFNTYFTFSEGFKAGVASGQFAPDIPAANPERLYAYEVGLKVAQPRYQANVAAFYYNYIDLQVETLTNHGFTTVPQNAAQAKIYGLDFDGTVKLVEGLDAKLTTTFIPHAKYSSFPNAIVYLPPLGPEGYVTDYHYDASGTRMIETPLWSGTISATYTKTLPAGVFQASPSLYFSSAYRWVYTGTVNTNAYTQLGATLSFAPTASSFKYSLYGKNLTNKAYIDGVTPNPAASVAFYGQPREIGLRADYSF